MGNEQGHLINPGYALGVVITACLSILTCVALHHAPEEIGEQPLVGVALRLLVLGMAIAIVSLLCSRVAPHRKRIFSICILSYFLSVSAYLVLKNTPYSFNGVFGDYGFRTSYITKFASNWRYVDFTYRDLPSFYPPLYFYVLGKISALLNIAPYKMLKLGLLFVVFILPFVSERLWAVVVGRRLSAPITFVLLINQLWFSPYEWLSLIIFIPWWLHFLEGTGTQSSPTNRIKWFAVGAILGGIIIQLYHYWFFLGILALLVGTVMRRDGSQDSQSSGRMRISHKILMLGLAAFCSAWYWAPLLHSMVASGEWRMLQVRYFAGSHVPFHLPFLDPSVRGMIYLGGLLSILLSLRRSRLSAALATLLAATYLWFMLGYIAALLDRPFLSARAYPLVDYILGIGAMTGLIRVCSIRQLKSYLADRYRLVQGVLCVVILLFLGEGAVDTISNHELLAQTLKIRYPDRLLESFESMTDGDYRDKVILTSHTDIMIYLPVYGFAQWSAYYSHPAGAFHKRIDFLRDISRIDDPSVFAAAIMNNRYDLIDYIMLDRDDSVYVFRYYDDNYPHSGKWRIISFPVRLFSSEYFESLIRDNYTLIAPRYENNPIKLEGLDVEDMGNWHLDKLILLAGLCGELGEHVGIHRSDVLFRKIASEIESRTSTQPSI